MDAFVYPPSILIIFTFLRYMYVWLLEYITRYNFWSMYDKKKQSMNMEKRRYNPTQGLKCVIECKWMYLSRKWSMHADYVKPNGWKEANLACLQ